MSKYTVITTFPLSHFNIGVSTVIESWHRHLPKEVNLLIQLDDFEREEEKMDVATNIGLICADRPTMVSTHFDESQNQWLRQFDGEIEPADYRKQYRRFSFKVFAIWAAYQQVKRTGSKYLIWMDADILINQPVTMDDLKAWSPDSQEIVSYMGRKDWDHSECGFMIFDVETAGAFIDEFRKVYLDNEVRVLDQWHDSYVFDYLLRTRNPHITPKNLTADVSGRDVFQSSPMGQKMHHYKGPNGKAQLAAYVANTSPEQPQAMPQNHKGNLKIQTRNCVPQETIRAQIRENHKKIPRYIDQCRVIDEDLVIVSAGPSMNPEDIRPFYDAGVKIVCVKHAIEPLLAAGIVPWACVLLDPREHVEAFVKSPHPDVIYFVASMVHPSVVDTLIDKNAKIIGYHAGVNANEQEVLPPDEILILGGSATATRSLSLFQVLGFRRFHLFGYDCCYYKKPDLSLIQPDGQPKYLEVDLTIKMFDGKKEQRTFWTEGQFMAQYQEIETILKQIDQGVSDISLKIYGEGIIPWIYRCGERNKILQRRYKEEDAKRLRKLNSINENIESWMS